MLFGQWTREINHIAFLFLCLSPVLNVGDMLVDDHASVLVLGNPPCKTSSILFAGLHERAIALSFPKLPGDVKD